jgi:Cu/Zn superoxide dismutase
MSTKGHFNPHGKPHGQPTSGERHAGDLPALKANKRGRAKVEPTLQKTTLVISVLEISTSCWKSSGWLAAPSGILAC